MNNPACERKNKKKNKKKSISVCWNLSTEKRELIKPVICRLFERLQNGYRFYGHEHVYSKEHSEDYPHKYLWLR